MPRLSVVVTIVEGGAALNRCLAALATQIDAPALEVIVPYDDACLAVAEFARSFPGVRFIDMGSVPPRRVGNAFDEHGLYERRRAAGLHAATGALVAMLEDRGSPRADWAAAMIRVHSASSAGAIGGVVQHGGQGAVRWALFFCDFGRYQPGVREGDAEYLSDVNICYKGAALEAVRPLWRDSYQESTVNWALRREGWGLQLSHAPVVVERRADARLWPAMLERMHWARTFAHVRGREAASSWTPLGWAAATPALPILLFARHLRREIGLRRHILDFLRATPAMLVLLHCWALGECIGYCEAASARPAGSQTAD